MIILQACYDVREAIQLWVNLQKKLHEEEHSYYWNSTHPNAEQRKALFEAILPEAIQLREDCDVRTCHYSKYHYNKAR